MFTMTASLWYAFATSLIIFTLAIIWGILHIRRSKKLLSLADMLEAGAGDQKVICDVVLKLRNLA